MFDQPNVFEKIAEVLKTHAAVVATLTALATTVLGAGSSIAAKLFSNVVRDRLRKSAERETEITISRGESWSTTKGSSYSTSESWGHSESDGTPAATFDINRSRTIDGHISNESRPMSPREASRVSRGRVSARLKEASTLLKSQLSIERRSNLASNTLTVAQYIIGGLLASSFVQQSLNPRIVGALGVLVLIASLFKQHFHPETDAEEARRRGLQLQAFIRTSEDDLAVLDAKIEGGQDHSDAMIALMKQMTKRLTEIENPEALQPALPRPKHE